MIALYWEIGIRITEQQTALGWGKSVVENLFQDIQKEFLGIHGFDTTLPEDIRNQAVLAVKDEYTLDFIGLAIVAYL